MDSENESLDKLLQDLPMHDASDEVVSHLLEKVEASPILALKASQTSRLAGLGARFLSVIESGLNTATTMLKRRRFASMAVAVCSLVFVLSFSMDSLLQHTGKNRRRALRPIASSEQGTGARDAYGDLIVAFKNDIETAKNERSEMYEALQRVINDLAEPNVGSHLGKRTDTGSFSDPQSSDAPFSDDFDASAERGQTASGTRSAVDSLRQEDKKSYDEEVNIAKVLEEESFDSGRRAYEMDQRRDESPMPGSAGGKEYARKTEKRDFGSLQGFSGSTASIGQERARKPSQEYSFRYSGSRVPEAKNTTADSEVLRTTKSVFKPKKQMSKDNLSVEKTDPATPGKSRYNFGKRKAQRYMKPATPPQPRPSEPVSSDSLASDFLKRYERIDGLRFKEAKGYWSNTYVPGSPSVRRLRAALNAQQLSSLRLPDPTLYAHDLAHQTYQPFDAPKNAALAVYLHANRKGLQGQQRMILQVGVKASERRSGRRPAMNIGVVLDLRKLPSKEALEGMRSLLFALNKEKDIGDRFSVTVAGRAGGTIIPASKFSHGYLSVAFKNFDSAVPHGDKALSLAQAIESARTEVSRSDDPSAPLGSSSIILVTASSFQSQIAALSQQAHSAAVEGITTSVLGVGNDLRPRELEQLALSGQGRRNVLNESNDAKSIIVKELNAVSQVVARAVRLRIRLAPGVKLIDVLGSERLDDPAAERVRQAEKSIDQRISKNLGIAADRGEDEEGIQIVIPAFYAGDSHVVLLDVLAPGPDAIADVQVRYKDLVFMKNGVVRSNLTLSRSEAARGPLEQNVLKNLLAYSLSEELKRCAQLMFSNQFDEARRRLSQQRDLLLSFQSSIPGFERDRGVRNDLLMLERYLQSLGAVSGAASAKPIALSLQYAGTQRVLPELLTE